MIRIATRARGLVWGLAVVTACNKDASTRDEQARDEPTVHERDADDGNRKRRLKKDRTPRFDRVPDVELPALGAPPGYIADGLVYAAVRSRSAHRFIKSLPWPADLQREAADAAREIGFDPLKTDWLSHFAIPDDAILSMTLLRPIDDAVADARTRLGPYAADPDAHGEPSKIPSGTTALSIAAPIRERLAAAAYHSRLHLPSRDPTRTREAIVGMFQPRDRTRGAEACRDLKGVAACTAESSGVLVLREERDAVVADLVMFAISSYDGPAPAWTSALEQAISATTIDVPHARSLGGDAAAFVDPGVLARLHAIERIGWALGSAEWSSSWDYDVGDALARIERFEALVAAPRLFPGVQIETLAPEGGDVHVRATWPLSGPLWGRLGARMMALPASPSPVPTIDALCEGAVICMRTRGIPDMRSVGARLTEQGFGDDIETVMRRLGRDEEYTFALLAAGGWANLLAVLATAPVSSGGGGPQVAIASSVRDAVLRAEGFGGSVKSFGFRGFLQLYADYVLYVRAQGSDVALAQGLAGFSGERTTEIDLGDARGKAMHLSTRSNDPRAEVFFQQTEPDAAGWIALADSVGRFEWLRGLATEVADAPPAYLEIPDLWRLLNALTGTDASTPELMQWSDRRTIRAVLELGAGSPRLRAAMLKR